MLKVKEKIREDTDRFYSHSYRVHQDDIDMVLSADTAEIRNALDLDMLEEKSKKLSAYLTPAMLDYLRKYKCNYYLSKCGRRFDMHYAGEYFSVNADGRRIKIYPDDDTEEAYKKINNEWRLI